MSSRRVFVGAFIAGVTQLVLLGSAAADVPKGPYAALDGGLAWTPTFFYAPFTFNCAVPPFFSPCTALNAVTYDVGWAAGAQVGYAFGGPRVEFEYNHRYNGASTISTLNGTQGATGSLTFNAYMVNVLYDIDTGSKWVPYGGLGLGVADVSANAIHSANPNVTSGFLDGSTTSFAAQFVFGVEYQASSKVGLFLDWRGLWASNAKFNYGLGCPNGGATSAGCLQTGVTGYDAWNGAFNLGLRIHF